MNTKQVALDRDTTVRVYKLDLKEKVRGIWDEEIPTINHTVIEARGVSAEILNSAAQLRYLCDQFCEDINTTVVERRVHDFEPMGKTLFYVLSESHLSIHTWPESGYMHLDLVTCMNEEKHQLEIASLFEKYFQPAHTRLIRMMY